MKFMDIDTAVTLGNESEITVLNNYCSKSKG